MKKDLIFAPILLAVGILICLLRVTGMTAHIVISAIGAAALIVYSVIAKKQWKIPALEIVMRVLYGIALITGIVVKVDYILAIAIIHKISAILFVVSFAVIFVHKLIVNKKQNGKV